MGNEDLGSHYSKIGDLNNALKAYSRMRDYCTTSNHIASTSFRIIAVSIEQRNWLAVQAQVMKIRNLQMKPDDQARTQPKVQAAMGLQQMCSGEYREAALSFVGVEPSLGDSYNDVLTSNDVAVYGGLCALASMSRSELQLKVLENPSFRSFLELEPHIRRAISFFCSSKYSQCLDILESYRADYLLDIYLQQHVAGLYKRVRTKSIVQYFQPFSRVTLDSMEQVFGQRIDPQSTSYETSKQAFRDELVGLIALRKLNARIDLENEVLIAKDADPRADMQKEAEQMVDRFIQEARLKLLRVNVINADLVVKAPSKKKAWDGDGTPAWLDEGTGGAAMSGHGFKGAGRSTRG
jgi:COP9 signalosome complex subunit 1